MRRTTPVSSFDIGESFGIAKTVSSNGRIRVTAQRRGFESYTIPFIFFRVSNISYYGIKIERMSTMCEMYEFPKQLELPKEEVEILQLLGEAYVVALYNSLTKVVGDIGSRDEMEEVARLVNKAFTEGMHRAIEKQEKGF